MPLVDLGRTDDDVLESARERFAEISRTGAFVLGEELALFESEFASWCGAAHGVGVSDGTAALRLALEALGAGPGREVVTVPLTFIATLEAIAMTGARPVLVDVDPGTRCMDPQLLADAIGPRTAAVIPVHLYGRMAPMDEILAAVRSVPVVEDAAQAHGATLGGRRAGSLGAAGCFSFYPTKNLGAMGDAGAVVSNDPELAERVRSLRHHGADPADANHHIRVGSTARMDNLQAAILRVKLERLESWNSTRRELASSYREQLRELPLELPPGDPDGGEHVYHLFSVAVDNRDEVLAELRERGIGAAAHYPTPAHLQPAWRSLGYEAGDLPASERASARALSLPLFPGMTAAEVELVAETLGEVLRGTRSG